MILTVVEARALYPSCSVVQCQDIGGLSRYPGYDYYAVWDRSEHCAGRPCVGYLLVPLTNAWVLYCQLGLLRSDVL